MAVATAVCEPAYPLRKQGNGLIIQGFVAPISSLIPSMIS